MSDKPNGLHPMALPLASTLAAVAVGFAAIYVTLGGGDNSRARPPAVPPPVTAPVAAPAPAARDVTAVLGAAAKLNVGEMTTFVFKKLPEAVPEVAFKDRNGADTSLKAWSGRVVLLNLWATWCAPCRKEMPALDRLQKELGSNDFEVVALAVDRAGSAAAAKFLGDVAAKNLGLYVDATARGATALKAIGMPTTILIDRQGREVGRLTGPAEWDSEEAKRLVRSMF